MKRSALRTDIAYPLVGTCVSRHATDGLLVLASPEGADAGGILRRSAGDDGAVPEPCAWSGSDPPSPRQAEPRMEGARPCLSCTSAAATRPKSSTVRHCARAREAGGLFTGSRIAGRP